MTLKTRIHGAVDKLFLEYDDILSKESFATRKEIENLAVSAIYGIATFDQEEALRFLNENPTVMNEPLLLPEGEHFAKLSLTKQISFRVISTASKVILPFVDDMLARQFGEDFDARETLLQAADAVHDEYCRLAAEDPALSMTAQRSDEYPEHRAMFDADPEAFIALTNQFAAYVYRHRLDLVRKRYVVAVEAWRAACQADHAVAA